MRNSIFRHIIRMASSLIAAVSTMVGIVSCIEPPLNLAAEEVLVDMPMVMVNMNLVWNLDIDWDVQWHYGWDSDDVDTWGEIDYPEPTSYEIRRYFVGDTPHQSHTNVDPFTIYGKSFRRTYEFGYYDMLIWSNIDADAQVLVIDESDLDEAHASTSISRGLTRVATRSESNNFNIVTGTSTDNSQVTGLFNQPEIFYATYPQDVHISRSKEDYDYFDEVELCWVKRLNCRLVPRVYIYLLQVIIKNNQSGRIKDVSGNNAISNMAAGTSVNYGRTWNMPAAVYFTSRMKRNINYEGQPVDIIGGKFTTFGLCDMPSYENGNNPEYAGSRTDLSNDLFLDLVFNNGAKQTLQIDITDQLRKQSHGGIITVVLDANDIPDPSSPDTGTGSLFVPTVEDYDEIIYDIIM
ncbi:MAG: hypothetical protein MJY79_00695 [Bacteroidaceae bacterium]|nr:hypothetical protein [Bacteroidaceae bacterium]